MLDYGRRSTSHAHIADQPKFYIVRFTVKVVMVRWKHYCFRFQIANMYVHDPVPNAGFHGMKINGTFILKIVRGAFVLQIMKHRQGDAEI